MSTDTLLALPPTRRADIIRPSRRFIPLIMPMLSTVGLDRMERADEAWESKVAFIEAMFRGVQDWCCVGSASPASSCIG